MVIVHTKIMLLDAPHVVWNLGWQLITIMKDIFIQKNKLLIGGIIDMDMKALYGDFKNHVDDMTDDDIKKSIDNAINNSIDEFIGFAKDEYDLTIIPTESDTPDTFEKIFGVEE